MNPNRYARWWALALVGGSALGCGLGGSGAADQADGKSRLTQRDTEIHHEPCDLSASGAESVDANGDGAPDVTIVRQWGKEACRAIDFNFDRKIDTWVYLDREGKLRRRENDYDRDGRTDEVIVYSGGSLVEKQRATTLGGRLDTWHFYVGGRLARTERDSDGDAVVDQWWEYPKVDHPECPVIHSDVNGDGRPDPGVSVDVCSERTGYVPADQDTGERRGFDFEGPGGALPTEVKEKDKEKEKTPLQAPPQGSK